MQCACILGLKIRLQIASTSRLPSVANLYAPAATADTGRDTDNHHINQSINISYKDENCATNIGNRIKRYMFGIVRGAKSSFPLPNLGFCPNKGGGV